MRIEPFTFLTAPPTSAPLARRMPPFTTSMSCVTRAPSPTSTPPLTVRAELTVGMCTHVQRAIDRRCLAHFGALANRYGSVDRRGAFGSGARRHVNRSENALWAAAREGYRSRGCEKGQHCRSRGSQYASRFPLYISVRPAAGHRAATRQLQIRWCGRQRNAPARRALACRASQAGL